MGRAGGSGSSKGNSATIKFILVYMNYLILHEKSAFYTNWYDRDNNYIDGMVIFNLNTDLYTLDGGLTWLNILEDHL